MNNDKLNKKLVVEKAPVIKKEKKKHNVGEIIITFLLIALVIYVLLEKLNVIDYLDFI